METGPEDSTVNPFQHLKHVVMIVAYMPGYKKLSTCVDTPFAKLSSTGGSEPLGALKSCQMPKSSKTSISDNENHEHEPP